MGADPGTQLRLTTQLCCLGAGEGAESGHDVSVAMNGTEIFSKEGIVDDLQQSIAFEESARQVARLLDLSPAE